jgi:hypothetical protein
MTNARKLLLHLFRAHGPQTEPEAKWWLTKFNLTRGQVAYALRSLRRERVLLMDGAKVGPRGRLVKRWALAPCRRSVAK